MPKKATPIKEKKEKKEKKAVAAATASAASAKPKTLVLLDSHAILHRAYHALPDFMSSKGEATGALYGLVTLLLKLVADLKPDYIIACYDLPGPTFRDEVYEHYKAKRQKTEDALVAQIIRSRDVFAAFSIPLYELAGFEADDLLGTITEKVRDSSELNTVIASGDMDTLQLVHGKKVRVYTLKKGIKDTVIYDEAAVAERFGFSPELLPDYKGLRGDPTDNIVGIPGVGEKTASTLIKNFGSIESMYATLKKNKQAFLDAGITPRIVELLEKNEEEALFSKMLGTIRRDAPIVFSIPENTWRDSVDIATVEKLFKELDFRTLGARVRSTLAPTTSALFQVGEGDETTQVPATANGEVSAEAQEAQEVISPEELKPVALALTVLDSNQMNPDLEDLLGFTGTRTFAEAREKILAEVSKEGLDKVYKDIELPLIPIIDSMEKWGVLVDIDYLAKLSKEYTEVLGELEKKIWDAAGEEFNINSPKQLGVVLFDKMNLGGKNQKKTATGMKSTRESELEKMRESHPIIDDLLKYREFQKLLSTYIDTIPKMVDAGNRLHTHFLQMGAATGRMSSNNPNLQNIPIKTELGRNIRYGFIAAPGFKLAAFDYSQIELRIAALLSHDEKLIGIFREGKDVHAAVASEVFGVSESEVTKDMRRQAKVINFGILYGMGVTALQQNLGTGRAEAKHFYEEYFKNFSGLAKYLETVKATAQKKGYTETYFGRRRHFTDLRSPIPYLRAAAERMAINAPIQGTQADVIKIAMKRIDVYLKKEKIENRVRLLLQVHDELIYEIEESLVESVAPKIRALMEGVLPKEEAEGIPFIANSSTGPSWGAMQ